MLSTPQSDLWDAYLAAENRALRSDRNDALTRFLDSFSDLAVDSQRNWALNLASKIVDGSDSTPVRMPLFRRVLLPHLQTAIADRLPGSARWLAGFAQHIYKCTDLGPQLDDGTLTEHGLLLAAIEHDPTDDASRHQLLKLLVSRLQYTLHELPTGVLYGNDGATVSECADLLSELDDFMQHANRLGVADDYADLIRDCRLHYKTYANYLADRCGAACYADFLSQVSDA